MGHITKKAIALGKAAPEGFGLPSALCDAILSADAVSFDVLDTLFVRLVSAPEDVFDLVGARHHLFGFHAHREAAQRRAFEVMAAEGRKEIDLDGIYACLPPLGVPAETLQASEEELELAVLRLNPQMAQALTFARANGRRVVLMSDMYLPRRFFEALCERDGLEVDHIFVSSACNATKRDHGALFDHVAETLKLAPGRILHVGDNPQSDVARARERGFQAFHYVPDQPATFPAGASLATRVVEGHARSQAYETDRSPWWRRGFGYGGPAAMAVTDWLVERAKADKLDLVLNVARDGYLSHALWPKDAAAPSVYFRTSRTALTLSAITDDTFDAHIPFLLSGAHGLTVEDVFARIGVEPPAEPLLRDLGFTAGVTFEEETREGFTGLMRLWRWRILRVCAEVRRGLHAYLHAAGLREDMRVGFFDVGWSGTTQAAFARAVAPFLDLDIRGYYLCLRDDETTRARRAESAMLAMISTDTHPPEQVEAVYANRVVSELFFSAPHPSVIGYRLQPDGRVAFVEDPGRGADPRLPEVATDIAEGALTSAEALRSLRSDLALPLPADALLSPLLHLALSPTAAQAAAFGSLHNFDAWGSSSVSTSWMARALEPGKPMRGDGWPAGVAAFQAGEPFSD